MKHFEYLALGFMTILVVAVVIIAVLCVAKLTATIGPIWLVFLAIVGLALFSYGVGRFILYHLDTD